MEVRPVEGGRIPQHPLDRCLDLFFLNTAEHFALVLSPEANENLLLEAAMPYLGVGDDRRLIEIFEAAHSVVLAVFSAPQNSDIVSKCIHHYIHSLFEVSLSLYLYYDSYHVLTAGFPPKSLSAPVPYGPENSHTHDSISFYNVDKSTFATNYHS